MTGRKQLPKIWVQAGNALGLSLARVTAAETSRFRLREGKDPWRRGSDHRMGEMSPASLLSGPCVLVWLSRFAGGTAGLVRRQATVTAHDERWLGAMGGLFLLYRSAAEVQVTRNGCIAAGGQSQGRVGIMLLQLLGVPTSAAPD